MPLTQCSEQQHCTLENSSCGKSNTFSAVYEGLPKRGPLKLRPQLNNLIYMTLEHSEEWSNKKRHVPGWRAQQELYAGQRSPWRGCH